jgi:pSer/pThr/pTyr-binding forkhead associated (FHA) protein
VLHWGGVMATLVFRQGALPTRIGLDREHTVIGRQPHCEVIVPDKSVNRQHARIVHRGWQFVLQDLQSRNGTYLNDWQIQGLCPLRDGDTIGVCEFRAYFVSPLPELTEPDWSASTDPQALLTWLREKCVSGRRM